MKFEVIISIAAILLSGIGVFLNVLYRKKDFYNQLLKEQINAGYFTMESLLQLTHSLNKGYDKFVGQPMTKHIASTGNVPPKDLIMQWQTGLSVNLEPEYMQSFNSVLARGFIFPADIQKDLRGYFEKISDLFENKNDENLGIALRQLYIPLANITDKLNHYFKIDKLSRQLNRLL